MISYDDLNFLFNINVSCAVGINKTIIEKKKYNQNMKIIHIGSVASVETTASVGYSMVKASLIAFTDNFFFDVKTKSTKETFGVGTLIAKPSTLPFRSGMISSRDFEAPVEVGTIDCPADRALLKSLWELSKSLWSDVYEWMVVIKALSILNLLLSTKATGARQFVVHEAAEIIKSLLVKKSMHIK